MTGNFDRDKEFAQDCLEKYLSGQHSNEIILGRLIRYRNHHCNQNEKGEWQYDGFIENYYNEFKLKRELTDHQIKNTLERIFPTQ